MIKVMNIISDSNIGGAGRTIINYLKYADREVFDVSVCLPAGSLLIEPLRKLGARVIEMEGIADRSLSLGAIRALKAAIKAEGADIVHTHGSMAGRIAARRAGAAVVYTRHSAFPVKSYMKRGPGRLLNKLINEHYADRIIAVSPAAAENLTDGGISPGLIDIVMNGVEPVTRAPEEECSRVREAFGLRQGDFAAGILARIEDYKGHEDILEAISLLRAEGRTIRLIIAGTGGFEAQVRRRAEELELGDAVIFAGFQQDVAPVLSILDVQLNASWGTEATSMALIEGFSLGLPAVASDYGGNPWVVEDGVNGLIFPARDSSSLADRLRRLMDEPGALASMGREAERVYREKFTGERFARNVEAVYRKALEARKNGK